MALFLTDRDIEGSERLLTRWILITKDRAISVAQTIEQICWAQQVTGRQIWGAVKRRVKQTDKPNEGPLTTFFLQTFGKLVGAAGGSADPSSMAADFIYSKRTNPGLKSSRSWTPETPLQRVKMHSFNATYIFIINYLTLATVSVVTVSGQFELNVIKLGFRLPE